MRLTAVPYKSIEIGYWISLKGPVTQPITHESLTNHAQTGFGELVRREIDQIFGVSGTCRGHKSMTNHVWITYEPRKYYLKSLTNHWHIAHVDAYEQIRCSIPRTFDARPTHKSLTERVQTRMPRERQRNERDTCAVYVWYEGGA